MTAREVADDYDDDDDDDGDDGDDDDGDVDDSNDEGDDRQKGCSVALIITESVKKIQGVINVVENVFFLPFFRPSTISFNVYIFYGIQ